MTASRPYTVFRHHGPHCRAAKHRTWYTAAQCLWPHAEWISGNAPWALVAYCPSASRPGRRVCLTVTLWATYRAAIQAKANLDQHGCGSRCGRDHRIILIGEDLVTAALAERSRQVQASVSRGRRLNLDQMP